jgi:uncharacterized protein (UPF0548 family)
MARGGMHFFVRWLTGTLILAVSSPVAAQEQAWGKAVDGLQLGLSLAPDSGPLPSELRLEVQLRNVTSTPRQLPLETCPHVQWTAFTSLHVRVASGRIFRFHIGSLIDIASIHPHGPVELPPGAVLRERFSLLPLVESHGLGDQDSTLGAQLQAPQQVELWVELPGASGRQRLSSGHLKHRLGLPTEAGAAAKGPCVSQLAASGGAACALLRDGTPWCWGSRPPGLSGGEEEDTDVPSPQPLRLLAGGLTELGMWGGILCGRTRQGAAYCAGGAFGASGGSGAVIGQPVRVHGLEGAVSLHVGPGELCARTAEDALWCWGRTGAQVQTAGELTAIRWEGSSGGVSQVAIGYGHACALRKDGTVWCWGANSEGQLGTGDTTSHPEPVQLSVLGQEGVSVAAGQAHTCAALRDGSVRCWGRSEYGALGLGKTQSSPSPAPVPGLSEVVRVAAGYQKTCAWKKDGSVWCFGEVLKDAPPQALALEPVELKELGRHVEEVTFGFRHTCARTAAQKGASGGDVLCWGEGTDGTLGGGTLEDTSRVVRVAGLSGKAVAVAAGDYFTCALTAEGSAWCWGGGFEGQLGSGHKRASPRPVRVRLPCSGK